MTRSRITAPLRQHWHHFMPKTVRPLGRRQFNNDRHLHRLSRRLHRDLCLPRLQRLDPTIFDDRDGRVSTGQRRLAGEFNRDAVGRLSADDQRVLVAVMD